MARISLKNYRLALSTALIVAALVSLRALLFELGVEGMQPTALVASIIGGGVFVLSLVIAGPAKRGVSSQPSREARSRSWSRSSSISAIRAR